MARVRAGAPAQPPRGTSPEFPRAERRPAEFVGGRAVGSAPVFRGARSSPKSAQHGRQSVPDELWGSRKQNLDQDVFSSWLVWFRKFQICKNPGNDN